MTALQCTHMHLTITMLQFTPFQFARSTVILRHLLLIAFFRFLANQLELHADSLVGQNADAQRGHIGRNFELQSKMMHLSSRVKSDK